MIKYKNRDRSFVLILIKNYIIFTLVLGILILLVYLMGILVQDSIIRAPKPDKLPGQQSILQEGYYDKLSMNELLGTSGYFEILNEDYKVIYTDSDNAEKSYTEREVELIPNYNANDFYMHKEYTTSTGEARTLITKNSYDWGTERYVDMAYMVLDEQLKIIETNALWGQDQFTKRELGFLTMMDSMLYDVSKYRFMDDVGNQRTLIMHAKRINQRSYEKLKSARKIFIPFYIVTYIVITAIFTIWMHRKVKEPLEVLNEGILSFAGGNRNSEIAFEGPREFEEIFESFNNMSRQLKESEKMKEKLIMEKQRMLADISHDLKTPITVIQGFAKAVCDGIVEDNKKEQYLNTIYTKSEALTELINTFYDYSKLEHPEFTLVKEEADFTEFLREYLAVKYEEISLQGFSLEAQLPEEKLMYELDKAQMRRVFENILSNSLKHNPSGTCIYVTLSKEEAAIRFAIGDDGTGIPEELQETIFDPFVVGDDSRNNRQGSGLGLAVCKKIIELHGGTLHLEKSYREEIRTLFVVRLPEQNK